MSFLDQDQVAIAPGASLSPMLGLGDKTLLGVHIPAVWTAASISFQVSPDGGVTWFEFLDAKGAVTSYAVAAGQYAAFDPALFRGMNAIKIRSGTSAVPVNQAAGAALLVANKRVM